MDAEELEQQVHERLDGADVAGAAQVLEQGAQDLEDEDGSAAVGVAALWEEIADALADRERFDDAIATIDHAAALGFEAVPEQRLAIAGYQLRAGRGDEASEIWEALAQERPDDPWVPMNAGVAHLDAEQADAAVDWLDDALEIILRRGDEDGLLGDLLEVREEALLAAGLEVDDLQKRGEALFGRQVRQGAAAGPELRPTPKTVLAWFPRDELEVAQQRWPNLVEQSEYEVYARGLQSRLIEFDGRGDRASLAPIYADAYETWADARGDDAAAATTLHAYAEDVAVLGNEVPWPPRRGEPCWCGSGEKYKKCCATVA